MAWCPECRTEYMPHVKVCRDCGSDLVEALPPLPRDEAVPMEIIYRSADEITAYNIANILTREGVEARVVCKEFSMFVVLSLGLGLWGEVIVPREDVERSHKILGRYLDSIQGAFEDKSPITGDESCADDESCDS